MKCRICHTEGDHRIYAAREMQFGTRERFEYFQCNQCKCLQISEIPEDMQRFYPENYYSYNSGSANQDSQNLLISFLQKQRCRTALFDRGYKLNNLLKPFIKYPKALYGTAPSVIRQAGITGYNATFLDVGCGSWSWWLSDLKELGFRKLTGSDPFLEKDVYTHGIRIYKKNISELNGQYSLITFHHSFEHITDQLATLLHAKRLLNNNGICMIRIPIVSSYEWETYGVNWFAMDPPRHLYLHSLESMELLMKEAGLEVINIEFDTTKDIFLLSEQYLKDIPYNSSTSYIVDPDKSMFTPDDFEKYRLLAEKVNREKVGGTAAFFIRPLI